jgi:NitT/TauT family transport system ATP-binding protein
MSAGLDSPTSGTVQRGTDHLGYVFQSPTLLPWRTVRANVELPLELRGVPRAERRERADRAIGLVGLGDFGQRRPRALSGGMRMRVSLARTLASDPDLLLLDEPFGAVDELTRQQLGQELTALFAARRRAALLVTHSVAEAVFVSTEVIAMSPRPGRVTGRVAVPFDYPRAAELRHDAEFTRLVAAVSERLRDGGTAL